MTKCMGEFLRVGEILMRLKNQMKTGVKERCFLLACLLSG